MLHLSWSCLKACFEPACRFLLHGLPRKTQVSCQGGLLAFFSIFNNLWRSSIGQKPAKMPEIEQSRPISDSSLAASPASSPASSPACIPDRSEEDRQGRRGKAGQPNGSASLLMQRAGGRNVPRFPFFRAWPTVFISRPAVCMNRKERTAR